ncbi:MAG: hypothetical protein KDD62_03755 [Bdellovibrionales bacterium]|nr:hypothetical protein [Bdellovibrionales bacterium]
MSDNQNTTNTEGGASVQGNANAGNDVVGRDKVNYNYHYYTQQSSSEPVIPQEDLNSLYRQGSTAHSFPLKRMMQIVKSFPFRKVITHPLLIVCISLLGMFWLYGVGKNVGREEGKQAAEDRIQPTLGANVHSLVTTNVYVDASRYPFDPTGVQVNRGDRVTVTPTDPNSTWNCSNGGEISAAGFTTGESRDLWIDPSANFCELIGRIGEDGAPIRIGSVRDFIAPQSGTLYLGVNDMWPKHCPPYDCFADNTGRLFVQIKVTPSESSP